VVQINRVAIGNDLKRNWLFFLLGVSLGTITLLRSEFQAPVLGLWILAAIPVLTIAGLVARWAWRGWLEFGRE
jgi:membrane protein DedA with SNARE-associated domain